MLIPLYYIFFSLSVSPTKSIKLITLFWLEKMDQMNKNAKKNLREDVKKRCERVVKMIGELMQSVGWNVTRNIDVENTIFGDN